MTKVFKKFIALFLFVSGITAPLAVVACKSELVDLANDVDNLDLGYLSDLKSSTILKAFAEKNHRVRMFYISSIVEGNTHTGVVETWPPHFYYKPAQLRVTYRSKLDFNEGDEIFREINNKNDKCIIAINILDSSYDEKVDGQVIAGVNSTPEGYVNVDYEIDRENMIYSFIISLKDTISDSFKSDESIPLWWGGGLRIVVTTLELKISLE